MIQCFLSGRREKIAPPTRYQSHEYSHPPLFHQIRTREALQQFSVVMNTYNTGTGKTRAALSHLLDLKGSNVLLIAPTNELISQHVQDAEKFVKTQNLDYKVLAARAFDIRGLAGDLRPGEALYRLIRNYTEFEALTTRRQSLIMVTNPDIFYYALYFRYGAHDQRNIFGEFLQKFNYIIIDEFHYYNTKQVANFLFAMTLFEEFGYFAVDNRRLCLLSATPRPEIITYLKQIFGERFKHIAPDNEPPESNAYDTTPALAPLNITLQSGNLTECLPNVTALLKTWIKEEALDGAIISDSLARVNETYLRLSSVFADTEMDRITGPQESSARQRAVTKPLILATPTVDIGYNFDKHDKPHRQNLDFVVCEARYQDDLIQRIGRAGRVLGKEHSDIPSRAIVLISDNAFNELRDLEGQSLTREDFISRIQNTESLPVKHALTVYLSSYALQEAVYPLFKINSIMPESQQEALAVLFNRLQTLFAPNATRSFASFIGGYRQYEKRRQWLQEIDRKSSRPPDRTATIVNLQDWMEWWQGASEHSPIEAYQPILDKIWKLHRDDLILFVQSQVALQEALFQFRDSFQGPTAVLYDEYEWFSKSRCTTYDIFHLIAHYHIILHETRQDFCHIHQLNDDETPAGDFYITLRAPRDRTLTIELKLSIRLSLQDFANRWMNRPVALPGLQILAREKGGDLLTGAIPTSIQDAWIKQPVVGVILTPEIKPYASFRLKNSGYYPYTLTIYSQQDQHSQEYSFYGGLAAFDVHAALRTITAIRDQLDNRPIII